MYDNSFADCVVRAKWKVCEVSWKLAVKSSLRDSKVLTRNLRISSTPNCLSIDALRCACKQHCLCNLLFVKKKTVMSYMINLLT